MRKKETIIEEIHSVIVFVMICPKFCFNFLPLRDKLRLECVSKQFQRTVFVKQYSMSLYLDDNIKNVFMFNRIKEKIINDMKSMETVLKKCPNIQRIDAIYETDYKILKNILQMITKYCNHLNEFNGTLIKSKGKEFKAFHKKFGSKLQNGITLSYLKSFKLFPNLQTLKLSPRDNLEQILQLNSKQVKRLELSVEKYKIREVLQKFHKISHLCLHLNTENEISVLNALKESAVIQSLIELKISTNGDKRCVLIINCLKQMAKKFPNLKRIEFFEKIILENISDIEELMSSLKVFPHLKRLYISLEFKSGLEFDEMFSYKGFPQQLTHLRLDFNGKPLNESVLKDIDIHLPKLQYLEINPKIIIDSKGVTQMADIVSRLSTFQTINLRLNYPISEQMKAKIAEKCRKNQKYFDLNN